MEAIDFSFISLHKETSQNKVVIKWIGMCHFPHVFFKVQSYHKVLTNWIINGWNF